MMHKSDLVDTNLFQGSHVFELLAFKVGPPPFQPLNHVAADAEFHNVVAVPSTQLGRLSKQGLISLESGQTRPSVNKRVGGVA